MAEFRLTTGSDLFVGTNGRDLFTEVQAGGSDNLQGERGFDRFFSEVRDAHIVIDLNFDSGARLDLSADPATWEPGDPSLSQYNFVDIEQFHIVNLDGVTILRGDSNNNHFQGTFGKGLLEGGRGDDTLHASEGNVTLNGGAGDDLLQVDKDIKTGPVRFIGGVGTDTAQISLGESGGVLRGRFTATSLDDAIQITTAQGEVFIVDDDVEFLEANDPTSPGRVIYTFAELSALASPQITGTDRAETLIGTDTDEAIIALAGDDWIVPGGGGDTVDGGDGNDMVSYAGLAGMIRLFETDAGFLVSHQSQRSTLIDIERVTGTSQRDVFKAAEGSFRGLGGPDSFRASGVGIGDYDGGAGRDFVEYNSSSSGIVASLFRGLGWEGDAQGDSYTDIENLSGTNFDDRLWGDDGDNFLEGLQGDDTFVRAAGDDIIYAGNGFDTAIFFERASSYDIDFGSNFDSPITVNDINVRDGDEGTNLLQSVEVLRFADTVFTIGRNSRDPQSWDSFAIMEGGFVYLRAGHDILSVLGGDGSGVYDGGSGKDILSFAEANEGVYASLLRGRVWEGETAGDRFDNFEWLRGSDFNDTLDGSRGNDTLEGGAGDDLIAGGFGDDYILAGVGTDTILFSGARAEYNIASNGFRTEVTHLNNGSDGFDVIGHAEVLQFTDGDFIL
ncbi:calcium-binding protein [Falsiruegeria mediterranea]|uniref:Bifunctional hemolysin/adenylate cyclase n=1 Tax=Falsiruegeria mediterranea M17 TaxID=1200281 RepID=A0A2R8C9W5_9RHOB|nr:calcium-binding protein [Falsiruegeria mediterranea]SPJ29212.1 Bifunctional hemolysin/adenylate cyclase [Falsiruegeria mediterranea M17]